LFAQGLRREVGEINEKFGNICQGEELWVKPFAKGLREFEGRALNHQGAIPKCTTKYQSEQTHTKRCAGIPNCTSVYQSIRPYLLLCVNYARARNRTAKPQPTQSLLSDFLTRGTRGDTVQRSPFDKNGIYQVRPLNTYLRLMNVLREFRPSLRSGRAVKGASLFDGVRGQYLRTKKERGRLNRPTLCVHHKKAAMAN